MNSHDDRVGSAGPGRLPHLLTPAEVAGLLRTAVEWNVIDRVPCSVKLLPVPKGSRSFHDVDEYERLVAAAKQIDPRGTRSVRIWRCEERQREPSKNSPSTGEAGGKVNG